MNTTPTYEAQKSSEKLEHLPNSRQLASHKSTLTFQHNYGILLGVNFDIQTVSLNFYVVRWNVGFLQDGKEMMPLNLRRIEVGC